MNDYKTKPRPKNTVVDRKRIDLLYNLVKERDYTEKELIKLGIERPTPLANLCKKEGKNVKYRQEDLNTNTFNPNKNVIKTFYLAKND